MRRADIAVLLAAAAFVVSVSAVLASVLLNLRRISDIDAGRPNPGLPWFLPLVAIVAFLAFLAIVVGIGMAAGREASLSEGRE